VPPCQPDVWSNPACSGVKALISRLSYGLARPHGIELWHDSDVSACEKQQGNVSKQKELRCFDTTYCYESKGIWSHEATYGQVDVDSSSLK
jgi:hypothetical protein